jgi:hypothetical protein
MVVQSVEGKEPMVLERGGGVLMVHFQVISYINNTGGVGGSGTVSSACLLCILCMNPLFFFIIIN